MKYFISGHRDITVKDFFDHYKPVIDKAVLDDENSIFVVGDCMGVDIMAQIYLEYLGVSKQMVTVYHRARFPMQHSGLYQTKGGYISDVDRDLTMTLNSDVDIAWVAPGRERSGTQQNIERRIWVNKRKEKGLTCTLQDIQSREANNFL